MSAIQTPRVQDFKIGGDFWTRIVSLVRDDVIPYQWEILNDRIEGAEPSHCIENFRIAAGESEVEYYGMVFQDSDVAKWLEAVAYSLSANPDAALERTADEVIALIGRAQMPDGYLNTYYQVKEPGKRWTNLLWCHELYCAGHMMEAAVAYNEATGKSELLDIMTRMAEHIDTVLGSEDGKLHGYPGHQEIELALVRMYDATKNPLMLKLAAYFLDQRGDNFFREECERRNSTFQIEMHDLADSYNQNHLPVRQQQSVEGHSVRALYMATGMADVARKTGDKVLADACRKLFDNMSSRRMYITGGVGSTHHGEAFSFDDDLPNDTVYAETCASIALCFFARAMLQLEIDSRYADEMERALYNTCLAGMSLDGHNFFYVNPLEVLPEASRKDPGKRHVLPVRPKWFGCACCPTNLARMVMSLGKYAYGYDGNELYAHLFIAGEVELGSVKLRLDTDYPYGGEMNYTLSAGEYALNIRVPGYAKGKFELTYNGEPISGELVNGYVRIARNFCDGDVVVLKLALAPRRVYSNPRVRENVGRVAVMYGPLVYCLEEPENGKLLRGVALDRQSEFEAKYRADKLCGILEIYADGSRLNETGDCQYVDEAPVREKCRLTFIPYYAWANRGENEMIIWVME